MRRSAATRAQAARSASTALRRTRARRPVFARCRPAPTAAPDRTADGDRCRRATRRRSRAGRRCQTDSRGASRAGSAPHPRSGARRDRLAPRLLFRGAEVEMGFLLRRHVWVADLIGIGIGAALAGHAAATLLGAALFGPAAPARPAQTAPPSAVSAAEKSIEGIVGRNVFCSTCGDEPLPEQTRRAPTLLAIMFAPPPSDPRWSVAIVRDDEMATTGPYGVGARLGDARIEAIEEVRVILDVGHGRREFLELLHRRLHAPPDGSRAPPDAVRDGVRKIG